MMGGNDGDDHPDEEERMRRWREIYGDMIPEKIVDTKIGEDGKRYYKVQWAVSSFEPAKNFLEAELLIRKYWDPVEKKLKLPSSKRKQNTNESVDGECASSSSSSSLSPSKSSSKSSSSRHVSTTEQISNSEEDVVKHEVRSKGKDDEIRKVDKPTMPPDEKHRQEEEHVLSTLNENNTGIESSTILISPTSCDKNQKEITNKPDNEPKNTETLNSTGKREIVNYEEDTTSSQKSEGTSSNEPLFKKPRMS